MCVCVCGCVSKFAVSLKMLLPNPEKGPGCAWTNSTSHQLVACFPQYANWASSIISIWKPTAHPPFWGTTILRITHLVPRASIEPDSPLRACGFRPSCTSVRVRLLMPPAQLLVQPRRPKLAPVYHPWKFCRQNYRSPASPVFKTSAGQLSGVSLRSRVNELFGIPNGNHKVDGSVRGRSWYLRSKRGKPGRPPNGRRKFISLFGLPCTSGGPKLGTQKVKKIYKIGESLGSASRAPFPATPSVAKRLDRALVQVVQSLTWQSMQKFPQASQKIRTHERF